jgi:hypothetical protein
MICSLNEIEAETRKAARGAGLSWGLAEEAGKAARWLEMHGLRSVPFFAALFEAYAGRDYTALAMASTAGCWRARGGMLCPVIAGAGLLDRADEIAAGRAIEMADLALPVLLAPFAAAIVKATGAGIVLEWPGVRFVFTGEGTWCDAERGALDAASAPHATCGKLAGAVRGTPLRPAIVGVPVDEAVWSRLDAFVQRTYVPASDESRLKGAGAGVLDTD